LYHTFVLLQLAKVVKARHSSWDYSEGQAYHPHKDSHILLGVLELVVQPKFQSGSQYLAALPMQHHQHHQSGSTVFQHVQSTCHSLSNRMGCHTTYTGLRISSLQNVNNSVTVVIKYTAGI
jgi:hypothetical protein